MAGFKVTMSAARAAGRRRSWRWLRHSLPPGSSRTRPNRRSPTATRAPSLCRTSHTNESGSFTFMVNGVYDQAVLDKLNWFCRDWRLNEPTKMDPHLFDIVWEVYRESGSTQPIDVLSGYRSPQTNAMLRRRSRQVAEHSAAHGRQGDRRPFHRRRHRAHPRHRHAHGGGRRRLLPDRRSRPGCISTAARSAIGRG